MQPKNYIASFQRMKGHMRTSREMILRGRKETLGYGNPILSGKPKPPGGAQEALEHIIHVIVNGVVDSLT